MGKSILITGGAGFIGTALTKALLARGDAVRIFDSFDTQSHPAGRPVFPADANVMEGDVRDGDALAKALQGMDTVIHCAAVAGTGQSQYQPERYSDVNVRGTAVLLEALPSSSVRTVILPASMASYGEGEYRCAEHGTMRPGLRSAARLLQREWEQYCPSCGAALLPLPLTEDAALQSRNIYALTKGMQESMLESLAGAQDLHVSSLRLFNVYGPGQSLHNPYTGVLAVFLARLKAGRQPLLYEDGRQMRDFVYIDDVVSAFLAALEHPAAGFRAFNIGTGTGTSIADAALGLARVLKVNISPSITGHFRFGDPRHCIADVTRARKELGWSAQTAFQDGLERLATWAKEASSQDRFDDVVAELTRRGIQR